MYYRRKILLSLMKDCENLIAEKFITESLLTKFNTKSFQKTHKRLMLVSTEPVLHTIRTAIGSFFLYTYGE